MSFLLPLQILLPTITYLALGYLFQIARLAEGQVFRGLSRLALRGLLSVSLFYSTYTADLAEAFDPRLIGFALGVSFLTILVVAFLTSRAVPDGPTAAAMIQGMFRGNFVLFGLSIVTSAYGPEAAAATSVLIAFIVPLYNISVVVIFELFRGGAPSKRTIVVNVLKNPLVLSVTLGLLLNLSGLALPGSARAILKDVGALGTPLMLISLGGQFSFGGFRRNLKALSLVCFVRLAAIPAVLIPVSIFLGFRGVHLLSLLVLFATPTASTSAAMAAEYGGNAPLAGDIVVASTGLSIFTLYGWLLLLTSLHLL